MEFSWDLNNINHVAPHGVSPEESEQVLQNAPFDIEPQYRNGERRLLQLGETDAGRVLWVVTALRGDSIRIVTAYPAKQSVRQLHAQLKEASHVQDARHPRLQE